MSDTPFTEQVRAAWAISRGDMAVDALVQFDRWLAEVKATAAAGALRAAANDPALRLKGHSGISITRLRARADDIHHTP